MQQTFLNLKYYCIMRQIYIKSDFEYAVPKKYVNASNTEPWL